VPLPSLSPEQRAAALEKAAASHPAVILLDHRLPDGDGVALIEPLLRTQPPPQIVMLTASTCGSGPRREKGFRNISPISLFDWRRTTGG